MDSATALRVQRLRAGGTTTHNAAEQGRFTRAAAQTKRRLEAINPLGKLIGRFGVTAIAPLRLIAETAHDMLTLRRERDRERIARSNARLARDRELAARQDHNAARHVIAMNRESNRPPPRLPDVAALVYAPHGPDACGVPVAA